MFASCHALLSTFLLLLLLTFHCCHAAPICNTGTYAEVIPSVLNTIQGPGRKTILQTVSTSSSIYVMGHVQDADAIFSPTMSISVADDKPVYFVARYLLDGTVMTVRSYTNNVAVLQILVSQRGVFVVGKTISSTTICNIAILQGSVFVQQQSDNVECEWVQILAKSSNPVAALDQTGIVVGVSFLRDGLTKTNIKIVKYLLDSGSPEYEFTTNPGNNGDQGVVKLVVRSRLVVFVGYFESTTIAPFSFIRKNSRIDYFIAALEMTDVLWEQTMGTPRYTLDVISLQLDSLDNIYLDANLIGDFSSHFEYADNHSMIRSGYVLLQIEKAKGNLVDVLSWPDMISGMQMAVLNDNSIASLVSIRSGNYFVGEKPVVCNHESCFALFNTKRGNRTMLSTFTWWQASTAQFAVDLESGTFFVTGTQTRDVPFALNKVVYPPESDSSVYSFTLVHSSAPMLVQMVHGDTDAVMSNPNTLSMDGNNFVSTIEFSASVLQPFGIENNFGRNFQIAILKNRQNCSSCVAGTFGQKEGNVSYCSSCAQGYRSNKESLLCFPCQAGSYYATETHAEFISGVFNALCLPCEAGRYSPVIAAQDASTCQLCSPGSYSLRESPTCTPCSSGMYNPIAGAVSCQSCPMGTFRALASATSLQDCVPCSAGYYSSAGSSSCQKCYPGSFSTAQAGSCELCSPGSFMPYQGASNCTLCSGGSFSNFYGSASCQSCSPGSYAAAGSSACTLCGAGYVSDAGATSCKKCALGYYNTQNGSSICLPCTPGTFSLSETECAPCQAGTYSSMVAATSQLSCAKCPNGTHSSVEGAFSLASCIPCTIGSFSYAGSSMCTPCSAGSSSAVFSATSCTLCAKGFYASYAGSSQCIACSAGTFANVMGSEVCQLCDAGTFSLQIAATSPNTCKTCDAGTFSSNRGSILCASCAAGSYTETEASTSCQLCPVGTFSKSVGSSSIQNCLPCAAGSYSTHNGSTSCTPCGIGYYSDKIGASNNDTCKLCAPGTYSPTIGASSCTPCSLGYYSAAVGATSNTTCVACSAGTFNSKIASTSINDCVPCSEGYYSIVATSSCLPCAQGFYNNEKGSTNCTKCGIGSFSAVVGSNNCTSCATGYYNALEGQSSCLPCAPNTFTNKTGSTACDLCPIGFLCYVSSAQPQEAMNSSYYTHDPYFSESQASQVYRAVETSTIRTVLLSLGGLFLILVLFIGGIVIYGLQRLNIQGRPRKIMFICDLFKLRHYTKTDMPIIKRGTYLGIMCTMIYYAIGIVLISLLSLDLLRNNVVDRKSIVPEKTLDAAFPTRIVSNFTFIILLHNFNDKDCTPTSRSIVGIVPNTLLNATLFSNFTCQIAISCVQCELDGKSQLVDITWDTQFASASVIEFFIFLPHYTEQPFFVYESLAPESSDYIFKGKAVATQMSLSLTRAYRTVLPQDNIANSFFTRRSGGTTTSGYVAAKFPSRLGSTVNSNSFFSQFGLRITISLDSDPNVFRIEQESLSSTLEWVSKLVSLLSAVFTFVSIGMRMLERYHVACCNKRESNAQELRIELLGAPFEK